MTTDTDTDTPDTPPNGCGLNADWNCSAWFYGPGEANRTPGGVYVVENEDDDPMTYSIVRRWYLDWVDAAGTIEGYPGATPEQAEQGDGGNDLIIELGEFATWTDADRAAQNIAEGFDADGFAHPPTHTYYSDSI